MGSFIKSSSLTKRKNYRKRERELKLCNTLVFMFYFFSFIHMTQMWLCLAQIWLYFKVQTNLLPMEKEKIKFPLYQFSYLICQFNINLDNSTPFSPFLFLCLHEKQKKLKQVIRPKKKKMLVKQQ